MKNDPIMDDVCVGMGILDKSVIRYVGATVTLFSI